MKKLLLLFASVVFAQAPQVAVFNNFSPTVKGMTVGADRCYIWASAPPWGPETACWTGAALQHIQVSMPGASMQGYAESTTSTITWLVSSTGKWQLTAQPKGGVALYREGSF